MMFQHAAPNSNSAGTSPTWFWLIRLCSLVRVKTIELTVILSVWKSSWYPENSFNVTSNSGQTLKSSFLTTKWGSDVDSCFWRMFATWHIRLTPNYCASIDLYSRPLFDNGALCSVNRNPLCVGLLGEVFYATTSIYHESESNTSSKGDSIYCTASRAIYATPEGLSKRSQHNQKW